MFGISERVVEGAYRVQVPCCLACPGTTRVTTLFATSLEAVLLPVRAKTRTCQ